MWFETAAIAVNMGQTPGQANGKHRYDGLVDGKGGVRCTPRWTMAQSVRDPIAIMLAAGVGL
jgi:hypothetical protein